MPKHNPDDERALICDITDLGREEVEVIREQLTNADIGDRPPDQAAE